MKNPDLTPTEEIILEVISELQFTVTEKFRLVDSYYPVISSFAFWTFVDRIIFVERLKLSLKN